MSTLQQLIAQREALEREIEITQQQGRVDALLQIRALMDEYGLSMSDLSGGGKRGPKTSSKGNKVAAKYRDDKSGQSWSGRGLQPNWLRAALAAGAQLSDFAVGTAAAD
jgi:DNA-binding protein H-NS